MGQWKVGEGVKKEFTVKIGFDTVSESVSDVTSVILGIIGLSNDDNMYVVEARIDNEVVFDNQGFKGQLRKRYWEWDNEVHMSESKRKALCYVAQECINCLRCRVEKYSDGSLICEKCHYNQETKKFEYDLMHLSGGGV